MEHIFLAHHAREDFHCEPIGKMVDLIRINYRIIVCVWFVEDRIESIGIVHQMWDRKYSYRE